MCSKLNSSVVKADMVLFVYRDIRMYDSAVSVRSVILTWTEVIATSLYGVQRGIFYGAPPPELLNLFGVWPTDVLILSSIEEQHVHDWIPIPLSRWACLEQTLHDTANPPQMMIEPACNVCLVTPPLEPPSYAEAVAAETIDLTSDDDTDDDVFYN